MGHKTSRCFLFKDLIQKAITKGRLKFGDKLEVQIKIDVDPLQVVEANYVEPFDINMVEVIEDFDQNTLVIVNVAHGTTRGSIQVRRTCLVTEGFIQEDEITKATEGLMEKMNDLGITEDTKVDINMVEIS